MRTKLVLPLAALMTAGCMVQAPPPALHGTAPPVIDSVTYRTAMNRYLVVFPEFHFHAADGNVNAIHREIVATNSPKPLNFVSDGVVNISPEQQRRGATYVGDWHCGPENYSVDLRAYLIDSNNNKSNPIDYTIHCDRG